MRVELPEGVQAHIEKRAITVSKGEKSVSRSFKSKIVKLEKENHSVIITVRPGNRKTNALINTIASHIKNMVNGITCGYKYKLLAVYSHFPMSIRVKENFVEIGNFAGEKKQRKIAILGKDTKVDVKGKEITVTGINKEHVGQTAANIERGTRVKGKDLRVFQDGIYIVEKGILMEGEPSG